ncbi:MAG: dehydratase [Lachnospiraceae bacterium]|jgi:3-hydroxybutyryl-CoA dehydratase|nr:dehydratase [Lachnospiraceae bacterium]
MNEYHYAEIEIGHEESFSVMINEEKMDMFKNITGDTNVLHNDINFAVEGGYDGKVVYGFLVASFYSTLAGVFLPGKWSLIYDVAELGMIAPVYIGDELTVSGKVVDRNDVYKMITLKLQIRNQNGKRVSKGKMRVIVRE